MACSLLLVDYARIAELHQHYTDRPSDFADLTVVGLSERLDVAEMLRLDSDLDVYRRFQNEPFQGVVLE